jgi:hypothetical protein
MTDAQWDSLLVPISMALFFFSTPANKVVALYPSPAGPTESLLTEYPLSIHAYAFSSHLVYGLTTEIVRGAVRSVL